MIIYNFFCDKCKKEFYEYQDVNVEHTFICPICGENTRRLFCTNFVIKGWSPANEMKIDDYIGTVDRALKDTTPVTKTEFEVAAEHLIKRADRRGEKSEDVLSEVLGIGKRRKKSKEELKKEAEKQREMIEKSKSKS